MDLDNFESDLHGPRLADDTKGKLTAKAALDIVDNGWYAKTTRSGRLMDLIGDYAGAEKFIIDGALSGAQLSCAF